MKNTQENLSIIVPYHRDNPNTWNGARLRSPSPIMAPDTTKHHQTRSNSTKQGGQTVKCLVTKQCLMVFGRQTFPFGRAFSSTFTPTVHINPSRKRSVDRTELFKNDDVTIMIWFSSNTNSKQSVIVAFLNFSSVVWTKNIWCVFSVKNRFKFLRPELQQILAACIKYSCGKIQGAVPEKTESLIFDQVRNLHLRKVRRYRPFLKKVYSFNDAMLCDNFLITCSKKIDSSKLYTPQCHASRTDNNTATVVGYDYFQINFADITKLKKLDKSCFINYK